MGENEPLDRRREPQGSHRVAAGWRQGGGRHAYHTGTARGQHAGRSREGGGKVRARGLPLGLGVMSNLLVGPARNFASWFLNIIG